MNTPTQDDEREREQMEALVQKFCTKEKARRAARANNNKDAFGKAYACDSFNDLRKDLDMLNVLRNPNPSEEIKRIGEESPLLELFGMHDFRNIFFGYVEGNVEHNQAEKVVDNMRVNVMSGALEKSGRGILLNRTDQVLLCCASEKVLKECYATGAPTAKSLNEKKRHIKPWLFFTECQSEELATVIWELVTRSEEYRNGSESGRKRMWLDYCNCLDWNPYDENNELLGKMIGKMKLDDYVPREECFKKEHEKMEKWLRAAYRMRTVTEIGRSFKIPNFDSIERGYSLSSNEDKKKPVDRKERREMQKKYKKLNKKMIKTGHSSRGKIMNFLAPKIPPFMVPLEEETIDILANLVGRICGRITDAGSEDESSESEYESAESA